MKPLETQTKQRLKVVLQSLIYLVLVFFLLREVDETTTIEECTGFDAPGRTLERNDYDFLIRHSTFEEPSNRRVVEVILDRKNEPDEIFTNLCAQREFTARVIDRLNELRVSVIALDKFYLVKSCPADDTGTRKLQESVHRSSATIARGIDTQLVQETEVGGQKVCLARKTDPNVSLEAANETSGLLRLDPNTKLVPLAWPVRGTDERRTKQSRVCLR
jgi:hypothetical protein